MFAALRRDHCRWIAAPIRFIHQRILVVDDDAGARRLVARLLGDAGYLVDEASTALAALELARDAEPAIGLLVTDIRIPLMNGIELAGRFTALVPGARVLLMSGYHEGGEVRHPLLAKPFTSDELLAAVGGLLGSGLLGSGRLEVRDAAR